MTLLNNRIARVEVDGEYTDSFKIERGTPQGDRVSPFIFILCIEILLIKFKSLNGRGIDNINSMENWNLNNLMRGEGNTECFADDLTVLFKMSRETVQLIKETLEHFYMVSGLSLNVKKTQLMVTGSEIYPIGEKIQRSKSGILGNITQH